MSETIYPKGIMAFSPNSNAPDFVKGNVVITPRELVDWLKEHTEYLTEYKDKKQLKLQLLEGNKGLYFKVDTFKPEQKSSLPPGDIGGPGYTNDDDPFA